MKRETLYILLVVSLFGLVQAINQTETVQTKIIIPYYNLPPSLVTNIPNQTWPAGTNFTNAFRLEDYFSDNDTLTYGLPQTPNITININLTTINNITGHYVSFFPNPNFIGTRNGTFNASDQNSTTTSNLVFFNVVNDTTPPQWSNPFTHPTIIYQNSEVDFYTTWTDNVQLAQYIFGIKQGADWVTYVKNFSGTETTAGQLIQISANPGHPVQWYFSAIDTSGNSNITDIQQFIVAEEPPDVNTNASTGSLTGIQKVESVKTQLENIKTFKIQPTEGFRLELKQGQRTAISLKITNTGNEDTKFNLKLRGLEELETKIDQEDFTIKPEDSKTVTIDISAGRYLTPDIYFGTLFIVSGGITIRVPIIVQVIPFKSRYSLTLTILDNSKKIQPGTAVNAIINISNLEDIEDSEVTLYYAIADFGGHIVNANEEHINFNKKEISQLITLKTSTDTPVGDYVLYGRTLIDNEINLASDSFEIGEKLNVGAFIRDNVIWLILLLLLLSIIIFIVRAYKDKERLRLLNLYLMIQELKSLVVQNKIEAAMAIYIRIKHAYGESVKITINQNKEEIIKEIKEFVNRVDVLNTVINQEQEPVKAPEEVKKEDKPKESISNKLIAETKKDEKQIEDSQNKSNQQMKK